ncbi:MAG: hypothetical protein KF816_17520 [Melioribacteraceae bacterium]|nr:hypothetical protein [Melioribacteraceae bacterium]
MRHAGLSKKSQLVFAGVIDIKRKKAAEAAFEVHTTAREPEYIKPTKRIL